MPGACLIMLINTAEFRSKNVRSFLSTITVDKFVGNLWTQLISHLFVTVFSRMAIFYTVEKIPFNSVRCFIAPDVKVFFSTSFYCWVAIRSRLEMDVD
jgi:hypothetical protein